MLEDNELSDPNYVDWKRNLMPVLTAAKVKCVLTIEVPRSPNIKYGKKDKFIKWHKDDAMVRCCILVSMTNMLQQQHQGLSMSTNIMVSVREIFGEQNRTTRLFTIKDPVSIKMVEGTLVREHMLKMIAYLNELHVLGASYKMDIMLASLFKSFSAFMLNYMINRLEYDDVRAA
ncbi:uncharacterized protein LOC143878947 [Tasmannia lanceolata]|uniref:uncharacterized protein LOC143878947 n=1 Tax=Tasmannia lanceolata TaxID=3420 RepID=UPI0040631AE0